MATAPSFTDEFRYNVQQRTDPWRVIHWEVFDTHLGGRRVASCSSREDAERLVNALHAADDQARTVWRVTIGDVGMLAGHDNITNEQRTQIAAALPHSSVWESVAAVVEQVMGA